MSECRHNWKQVNGIYFVCVVPGCGEKWNADRLANNMQSRIEDLEKLLKIQQGPGCDVSAADKVIETLEEKILASLKERENRDRSRRNSEPGGIFLDFRTAVEAATWVRLGKQMEREDRPCRHFLYERLKEEQAKGGKT
ncbi:MAG: hypothetical protein P4N59_03640 [Negativicutes bacterium]|nr:hypothetical protein [Negativicutes bacterium]